MTYIPDPSQVAEVHPFVPRGRTGDDTGPSWSAAGDTEPSAKRLRIKPTPYVWRDPSTIPPREWLYDRHYVRKYATATFAQGGLGKSSLALTEAIAMATGRPLLGVQPHGRFNVWIWNGEDPLEETERRLAAILLHYDIPAEEVAGRLFIDSGREVPIIIAEKQGENVKVAVPVVEAVRDAIRENAIDVFMVDPFVSCHGVPENDNGAIDRVAKTWAKIADECACSVELVHHVRKHGGGVTADYTVEDARGAVALIGAVRSARVLNFMSKEDAEKAEVPTNQRLFHFRVDNGKSNMQPPLDRATWRRLVNVDLGNATDAYAGDSVGVVTSWTMPGLFDGLTTDDLRRVQIKIASGNWAENSQAGNWAGYAVAEVLEISAGTASEKTRIKSLLAIWIKSKALKVGREHDSRNGRDRPTIIVGDPV